MRNKIKDNIAGIAAVSSLAAGFIHLFLVSRSHNSIPPEMAFFMVFGIAQIVWAIWFLSNKEDLTFHPGLVINGGLLVTWLLTRILRAPFIDSPEPVGILGVLVVVLEGVAIISLVLWHQSTKQIRSMLEVMNYAIIISVISGIVLYGSGIIGENLFPQYIGVHSHSHSHQEMSDHHDNVDDHHVEDGHNVVDVH